MNKNEDTKFTKCCSKDKPNLKNNHINWKIASLSTIHCLIGCSIGEFLGLYIGVSLGMSAGKIIILCTTLAYISGFSLGLIPIIKNQNVNFLQAFRIIWIGEIISIAVMELAMNITDYHLGGMTVSSVISPKFWFSFLFALLAGFLAALPVNYLLIKNHIKKQCH